MSKFLKKGLDIGGKAVKNTQEATKQLAKARPKEALGALMSGSADLELDSLLHNNPVQKLNLHGDLVVTIHSARDLPNMDAQGLDRSGGKTDAYVRMSVDGTKSSRTQTVPNNLNPVWDEEFDIPMHGEVGLLVLDVKDEDTFTPERVGLVAIPIQSFMNQGIQNQWFSITGPKAKGGQIMVSGVFVDAGRASATAHVVKSPFPVRHGCMVRLYQDAHCDENERNPPIHTADGPWRRESYFEDLYMAIVNATQFIYITGWSVWAGVTLLRERPLDNRGHPTLGDLLKEKAAAGVTVRLLLWDEVMSIDNKLVNGVLSKTKKGMMGTWDEQTKKFFNGTSVICELAYRKGRQNQRYGALGNMSTSLGFLGTQALFTHHQKTVVMDAAVEGNPSRRRVVAFVGGLDLTSGRFDTPTHPLFSTLHTTHKGDVLQRLPNFDPNAGPRQPWHDIHSRVEGPIAWDVMLNFEQRWKQQASRRVKDSLAVLLPPTFLTRDEEEQRGRPDPRAWSVQMFRSIDDNSALKEEKGIEASILEAYVHQIRRAERSIYIENQYFLGSSTHWDGFDDVKWNVDCKHPIPAELAAKIVSKINARQRFVAYVLIPLFPEGIPEAQAPQGILYWQYKTVQMMYDKISKALQAIGSNEEPTDYLVMLCIGAREPGPAVPVKEERQELLQKTRRHMIYVHSKMMIVDDQYIIVGSANINERSMAGDRDTEIAVGMMQPGYSRNDASSTPFINTAAITPGMGPTGSMPGYAPAPGYQPPGSIGYPTGVAPGINAATNPEKIGKGDVFGFRMSLWHEHLAVSEECFTRPESLECVRRVKQLSEHNWRLYTSDTTVTAMTGHMMKYPYDIDPRTGVVTTHNCPTIPDCLKEATMQGHEVDLPFILTT